MVFWPKKERRNLFVEEDERQGKGQLRKRFHLNFILHQFWFRCNFIAQLMVQRGEAEAVITYHRWLWFLRRMGGWLGGSSGVINFKWIKCRRFSRPSFWWVFEWSQGFDSILIWIFVNFLELLLVFLDFTHFSFRIFDFPLKPRRLYHLTSCQPKTSPSP